MHAGMDGWSGHPILHSVIVTIFNAEGLMVDIGPLEAQPPPPIDADAVLSGPIPAELLKMIARRIAKISRAGCSIEEFQLLVGFHAKRLELLHALASSEP
jgi:hypothetical protein